MANSNQRNVSINRAFGQRIEAHRRKLGLTRVELAERASLSERTVRNIELGNQGVIQEKTLMLLAEALGAKPNRLLRGNWYQDRRILLTGAVVALVILFVGPWLVWREAKVNSNWTLTKTSLEVRDSILGRVLWRLDQSGMKCIVSPWDSHHLIIGLMSSYVVDDSIFCLDRATGDTLWSVGPDIDAVMRAFPRDQVEVANFSCNRLLVGDLQGDGEAELIACLNHGLNYPYVILVVDRSGVLESQYANCGHLFDVKAADIDDDGKDEIVGAGVNNLHAGATIVILDDQHRNGASVDEFVFPESSEVDDSLVRVVLPSFPQPYMDLIKTDRICATKIRFKHRIDGEATIIVGVGDHLNPTYMAVLDKDLRIEEIVLNDSFRQRVMVDWPDSLKVGTGPMDEDWQRQWLQGILRFSRVN